MLHNYLETLSSRYSDYDGFWVFGLLFHNLGAIKIDLDSQSSLLPGDPVLVWFEAESRRKFAEQIAKDRIPIEYVRAARLVCEVVSKPFSGSIGGSPTEGATCRLTVSVTSDLGAEYSRKKEFFVAPHDPSREHRSTRSRAKPGATTPR